MRQDVATPARTIVVDDHDLVRESMRDMLESEADLDIVGEAADGREAVELSLRKRPDLVIMDVRMPRMDGLTATREIKVENPATAVLLITMHENPDYLLEALRAGAAGYVLKDASRDELLTAVRRVLSGDSPLDPGLSARLLKRLVAEGPARSLPEKAGHVQPLTSREIEVLELVALGRTNREIAQSFTLSVGTVKNHVEHIIAKLGVSDRTQAVVRALQLGIISYPEP